MNDDDDVFDDYDDDWDSFVPEEWESEDSLDDMDYRIDLWYADPTWDGDLAREKNSSGEYELVLELEDGSYKRFTSVSELDDYIEVWIDSNS